MRLAVSLYVARLPLSKGVEPCGNEIWTGEEYIETDQADLRGALEFDGFVYIARFSQRAARGEQFDTRIGELLRLFVALVRSGEVLRLGVVLANGSIELVKVDRRSDGGETGERELQVGRNRAAHAAG